MDQMIQIAKETGMDWLDRISSSNLYMEQNVKIKLVQVEKVIM
jgi:hypothetical protein